MGVLNRFEKTVERALSNTFARAFKADLKPVDIASALRTQMDDQTASLSRGRTAVPNVFVIELGPADLVRVEEWGHDALIEDLIRTATSHATDQGYVFVGPLSVNIQEVPDLKPGQFTIHSSSEYVVPDHGAPATPSRAPAEPGSRSVDLTAQPIIDVDGQRYLLTGAATILGRGSEADIIVQDPGVSRRHLKIEITTDGVIATDLGSTNGTFVEGHRIDAATLVDGNTVTIGRTRITYWAGEVG